MEEPMEHGTEQVDASAAFGRCYMMKSDGVVEIGQQADPEVPPGLLPRKVAHSAGHEAVVPEFDEFLMLVERQRRWQAAADESSDVIGGHAALGELPVEHNDRSVGAGVVEDQVVSPEIPVNDRFWSRRQQ